MFSIEESRCMNNPKPTQYSGACDLRLMRPGFELDISFKLPAHGVLGIFGPSGSGKTSVLRCLAGLEPNARGNITIGGNVWLNEKAVSLPTHRRRIAYVFQDSRLFPHLNVHNNLHYGRKRRIASGQAVSKDEVVALLGIDSLLEKKPAQLSGGERQRVAIARALLSDPEILLLDEPLASLDDARKQEVLPFLDRLHRTVSIPMVYVSHNVQEIQRLCDSLIIIKNGKKTYDGDVTAALMQNDGQLSSDANAGVLVRGEVIDYEQDGGVSVIALTDQERLYIAAKFDLGAHIALRIQASNISISLDKPTRSSVLNILRGTLKECISQTDHHAMIAIDVAGQTLLARISKKSWHQLELAPNMSVFVQVKAVSINDAVFID